MEGRRRNTKVLYNSNTDLLYLRLDDRKRQVTNSRLSDKIVPGEGDRTVGIEMIDASKHLNLSQPFPVEYEVSREAI